MGVLGRGEKIQMVTVFPEYLTGCYSVFTLPLLPVVQSFSLGFKSCAKTRSRKIPNQTRFGCASLLIWNARGQYLYSILTSQRWQTMHYSSLCFWLNAMTHGSCKQTIHSKVRGQLELELYITNISYNSRVSELLTKNV